MSYDRLGIGKSQHGDPLNEIQANIEIAALRSLTSQLRSGSFPGVKTAYDTIVHVGHSFGSVQSYIFAHRYPDETQGIVLTGFALNSSFLGYFLAAGNFQLASVNSPLRFGSPDLAGTVQDFLFKYTPLFDYVQPIDVTALDQTPQNLPDGYIVPTNAGGNQFQFLEPPYFDVDIVPFIESSKQPVTLGEILTIGNIPAPNDFAGPVLVFTGGAYTTFPSFLPSSFLPTSFYAKETLLDSIAISCLLTIREQTPTSPSAAVTATRPAARPPPSRIRSRKPSPRSATTTSPPTFSPQPATALPRTTTLLAATRSSPIG